MNEFQLKYGTNPNQKPARIFMADGSDLPVTILNGKPGYINFLDALNAWQLVKELKEKGCGIYLCSNCSVRLRVFEQEIPGIEYFDGTLVSAEEKLAKPNPAIYERLFEKFHLKAEECFFIDDRQDNIDSAKGCGMDGYCFADGNVEKLRAYMGKMEIL